jgi:hypothetical protein
MEDMIKNNDFKPVTTVNNILGIPAGAVLKFDSASGKYVSVNREEDIADSSYYYSGFAVAIDPAIVWANMGDYFEYIEEPKLNSLRQNYDIGLEEVKEDYSMKNWQPCDVAHPAINKEVKEEPQVEDFNNMPEEWKERNKIHCGNCEECSTTVENVIEEVSTFPTEDETAKEEPKDEIPVPDNAYSVPEGILTFECGLCHFKNPIHRMRYGLFFPVAEETKLNLKCTNCELETTVFYELV